LANNCAANIDLDEGTCSLDMPEASRRFTGTAVLLDLIIDLLAINQDREARAFDGEI